MQDFDFDAPEHSPFSGVVLHDFSSREFQLRERDAVSFERQAAAWERVAAALERLAASHEAP